MILFFLFMLMLIDKRAEMPLRMLKATYVVGCLYILTLGGHILIYDERNMLSEISYGGMLCYYETAACSRIDFLDL